MTRTGYLLLEDGRRFDGECVGADGVVLGEVVFNTSMTGYQEVLTDPSYAGQLVTMTYPMIGNYGASSDDDESPGPQAAGMLVRELSRHHSGWRADESFEAYLRRTGVVALSEVDTRAITRHIRSAGAMRGAIAPAETDPDTLLERVMAHPRMEGRDLTGSVTTASTYETKPGTGAERFRVAAYDFGVKRNSQRLLADRGCRVVTFPASASADEVLDLDPDGVFLSNGPGDPEVVPHALEVVRRAGAAGVPVFGICLGHQLVARAFGGRTFKMLYGHRGGNHPVRRLEDGAVEITAQNHGFAVRGGVDDEVEDAPALRVTHTNLNDHTIEGVAHREYSVSSVQYHPEAAPGPHDSRYLFDQFIERMAEDRDGS